MKLPALAIAIGLWPLVTNRACSREFVFGEAATALLLIAVAAFFLSRQFLRGPRYSRWRFLDRSESVNFQKTGVFHVLVVAGLHVGAFAAFLFWAVRRNSSNVC